jgi:molecular chaperone DnaK
MQTEINLPFITADASGPKHLVMTLTRAKLEQLVADLLDKMVGPCKQAMTDAKVTTADIDEIIMVGGMTRMPAVQKVAKTLFNKEPNLSVNPDEVVGVGAAIQGGVLKGEVKDLLLLDVTPLTLGIETLGGVTTPLIPRNTTIPTSKSEVFSTAADGQTIVEVHVLQGERTMAPENKTIGRFRLEGVLPAPRGVPQIEVTFDIDANGILNVSAKDKGTGKQQRITITASSGLSKDEVSRMVREAESHAEEDKQKRQEVETRNTAENAAYAAEKLLKDNPDKVPADLKTDIEAKIAAVRTALAANNIGQVNVALQELQAAMQKVGEAVYSKQGSPGGQGPSAGGPSAEGQGPSGGQGPGPEGTVEGEYREV